MSLPVFIFHIDALLAGEKVELPSVGERVVLDGSEGRHAVSVKRIAPGERIQLISGNGTRATVLVEQTSGKDTLVGVVEELKESKHSHPTVTVFQAIPKSERSELAVDLLTQGGVDAIVAWEASRCVAKWQGNKRDKGIKKWRQAALSAVKQSRRDTIPTVTGPISTTELLAEIESDVFDEVLVLHEEAARSFTELDLKSAQNIALIIGPEGGIAPEEATAFSEAGATAIKLGPEVLRTATAGLVALAAIGVSTSRWD